VGGLVESWGGGFGRWMDQIGLIDDSACFYSKVSEWVLYSVGWVSGGRFEG
jgi:hypothetical protein